MKAFTESSKEGLADALGTFISVDNARESVTKGELAQFKEAHKSCVVKLEVMTPLSEEQGRQTLFVHASKILRTLGTAVDGGGLVVLCQDLLQPDKEEEWIGMHEKLK